MVLLDDPLMRRELSGVSRRWQTFAFRALVLGFLAYVLYSFVETFQRRYGFGAGTSDLADLARVVFGGVFSSLMLCLPLQAVAAAADLVTKEVRNGTLGLLVLTPLTPWRILLGKWKAVMAQVATLLLAAAPIDAACVFLGGVEPWDLLWGAALPLSAAGFASALTLLFSALLRSSGVVMIASIVALLAGVILPNLERSRDGLLPFVHPVFSAEVLTTSAWNAWRVPGLNEVRDYGWITASSSAFLGALVLLRLASWRLRQRVNEVPAPGLLSRLMVRLDVFYESINVGRVRFLARAGGVWETHALLWKELRTRSSGKLRHATRIALALLLLSAVLLSGHFSRHFESRGILLWLAAGLLALQAVVAGVSLFVHEKEGRQWEVLLSTPLTAPQIVTCKLGGGIVSLAPTAAVALLCLSVLAFILPRGMLIWVAVAVPTGLFMLLAYLLSAAASLRCATQRGAFALSTGLLLGILLGLPLVARMLGVDGDDLLLWTNPCWYLDGATAHLRWGYGSGWMEDRMAGHLLPYAATYLAGAAAVLFWMLKRFDRLAGRA